MKYEKGYIGGVNWFYKNHNLFNTEKSERIFNRLKRLEYLVIANSNRNEDNQLALSNKFYKTQFKLFHLNTVRTYNLSFNHKVTDIFTMEERI